MKLSIIIVHYDTPDDLARCLASLGAQPPACPHEIVVVDNASRAPGLDGLRARHPGVRWLLNPENVGYARAVNQGFAAAPADFHLVLNPDIVVAPGSVDALLAFAESRPRAGIVGPQLLNEDGTVQDSCRRFYTFRVLLLRRTFLGRLRPRDRAVDAHLMRDFDHREERAVDWVLGGCMLARRAALERVGPLDGRFFLYFEDVDWCFRMWQAGWEVLYFPGARFTHRHRRQSAQGGALRRGFWLHLSSLISFYEKWGLLVYLLKRWRGPVGVALQWGIDMTALGGALLGAYALRAAGNRLFPAPLFPLRDYGPLFLFCALLATVTFLLRGRYRGGSRRGAGGLARRARETGTVALLLLASTYLSHQQTYSRAVLLLFAPLAAAALAAGEGLFAAARRRLERGWLSLERTLLVGPPAAVGAWLDAHGDGRALGRVPVGFLAPAPAQVPPAPLAGGTVPWLGAPEALPELVERYRISQVVFWDWPQGDTGARAHLDALRRRRIRLRWRVEEAWLLEAGARSEPFGGSSSVVLDPQTVAPRVARRRAGARRGGHGQAGGDAI
ncbi:MAG: glycosyltransferase family 2 protein [Candidatus Krumholzibacteriia bacterium]